MDPFLMALLAEAGAKGVGQIAQAGSQFATGRDLRLNEEQKKRLRELERLEALNEFGLTPAQREAYQAQALSPVQAAERQALAQFGASQAIGDIGQGAAFRQQQAIKEGSEESRAKIAQAVAEKEAQAAQQQAAQLEALQAQDRKARQLQRDAAFGLLGGLAEAGAEAAGMKAEQQVMESLYEKRLDQLSGVQKQTSDATRGMLGIPPVDIPPDEASAESGEAFVPKSREEVARQAEEDIFSQDPAKYLSDLVEEPEDAMNTDRTLRKLLGEGYGLGARGRSQAEYYDTTMGIAPNSQLEPAQRLDQLGQPVADANTQASGVVEPSNVQREAMQEPYVERLMTVPNSDVQGFLAPNGTSIIVPINNAGEVDYRTTNPMTVRYFNPSTGAFEGQANYGEILSKPQGQQMWKNITDELRAAMGESL